jgi:hypothetical protein
MESDAVVLAEDSAERHKTRRPHEASDIDLGLTLSRRARDARAPRSRCPGRAKRPPFRVGRLHREPTVSQPVPLTGVLLLSPAQIPVRQKFDRRSPDFANHQTANGYRPR